MFKAPYDEQNKADYLVISNNIEAALNIISTDLNISATEKSLAKLAGCSRGTLRNRVYPLEKLRYIKKQRSEKLKAGRKSSRITSAHRVAVEVHIDDKKKLLAQLDESRAQVAVWVKKYSDLEITYKRTCRVKEFFEKGKNLLEAEVKELKALLKENNSSEIN